MMLAGFTCSANELFKFICKFFDRHNEINLSKASATPLGSFGEEIIPPPFLNRSATTPLFGLRARIGRFACR